MNKELIKKYKAEFDHWLNGGKLLYNCGNVWIEVLSGFRWDNNVRDDYQFIIDDEYVEFRKALAEGKTVEYNHFGPWTALINLQGTWFTKNDTVESYRIKPDESKFKQTRRNK